MSKVRAPGPRQPATQRSVQTQVPQQAQPALGAGEKEPTLGVDALLERAKRLGHRPPQPPGALQRRPLPGALGIEIPRAPAARLQRTSIDVTYNYQPGADGAAGANQGRLRTTLAYLAGRDQDYYNAFPDDAFGAIMRALNALDPAALAQGEDVHIATIKQKLKTAVDSKLVIEWSGNDVSAKMGDKTVATFEFVDYDDDGKMWITAMNTKDDAATGQTWRHLGIGLSLLQAAVTHFGAVYASKGSKHEHDPDDDGDDTRWLTADGAGLINAAVAKNIIDAAWYYNPIAQAAADDGDDDL